MKQRTSLWRQLQSGQAMMEYWPTIGASVAFLTLAAGLSLGIWNMYRAAIDAFDRAGGPTETCTASQIDAEGGSSDSADMQSPADGASVGDVERLGDHRVELVAGRYDAETGRTTIAYRITSGDRPAISHVIFGFATCAEVLQASEPVGYVDPDPTTGAVGYKFDTGYEDLESRIVYVTLRGQVQMGSIGVTTKSGRGQVYTGSITGPVSCQVIGPEDTNEDVNYAGCVPD